MAGSTQLYNALEELSRRYERLQKKFHEFFESAGYLATERSRIRGIVFDEHLEENYFKVAFCGQIVQFQFSVALDAGGASKGVVSCLTANPLDSSKQNLVTTFTYSGTGGVDVPKPDDFEDPIAMDDVAGAVFLVCVCLHKALTK